MEQKKLVFRHFHVLNAGVIDSDFTGTLKLILINLSSKTFKVDVGDRLGQMVVERYFGGDGEEVHSFAKESERGEDGMGSTGISAQDINM